MSVRKYIHPRNKYKTPPDYKKLAIKYPEFRQIAITDLGGRVRIDFQNEKSLRTLTETLLMHDFDLHVRIPSDKLNPTITLRMNYILWIEDLMNHLKLEMDKVIGIDIGTGATCIYALLLAKIYGCHMIGTEVDELSVEHARDCIHKNNLEDLIKVITVKPGRIFKDAIENNDTYDFSMCNPPFFKSEDDTERIAKALPPRNTSTGNDNELKTIGGEWAFVAQMIDESVELGDRIKVYSTMIGRKVDLIRLKKEIISRGTTNVTWTEFCQGYTTRWGLAWSFLPTSVVDLTTAPVIRKNGKSIVQSIKKETLKKETSITIPVEDKFSCMNDLISFLTIMAKELNITLFHIPVCEDSFNGWMCRIIARERSWEHARRKRRLALRQTASKRLNNRDIKCIEGNDEDISNTILVTEESNDTARVNQNSDATSSVITVEKNVETVNEEKSEEEILDERIPILACKLCVEIESSECEENDIFKIWMIYENGSGGLDALHSLQQYLINKLGVREKVFNSSKNSKKRKRKKVKRDAQAGTSFAVPIVRSQVNNEDSSKKEDSSDDC